MTTVKRLLFVLGCVLCLIVVASALPAADPRLEGPGEHTGEPAAGEWEAIEETPDFSTEPHDGGVDVEDEADDDDADEEPDIEISGAIEPGNEVGIQTDYIGPLGNSRTVEVNGEKVGETDNFGRVEADVPYDEEMTVSVPAENVSRTVDVETDATVDEHDGRVPGGEFTVSIDVGSTPVENATVSIEGEAVAETDEDGYATVTLPEAAGPTELRVERGPVEAAETIDVTEPGVEFVSPLLFPGSPAPVQVSADGTGVSNATVSIDDDDGSTTGGDGRTTVWLPIDDEATVTAQVGEETATTSVENLYLRLGALAVLVPGFVIGGAATYLRLAATRGRQRRIALGGLFVGLADILGTFAGTLSRLSGSLRGLPGAFSGAFGASGGPRVSSVPRFGISMPRVGFDWRRPSLGWRVPSFGSAIAPFGGALGSLPSLGSMFGSSSRTAGSLFDESPLEGWFGDNESEPTDADEADGSDGATRLMADEPLAPRNPRVEIRAAWHAFLDRLDLVDRETLTPGQAARRALALGFSAERVYRLTSIFRDVEYGSREPSPERVADARETASELIDRDPDEEGST